MHRGLCVTAGINLVRGQVNWETGVLSACVCDLQNLYVRFVADT
jgi:hypothetical protein